MTDVGTIEIDFTKTCITGNHLVQTENGNFKKVSELEVGDKIKNPPCLITNKFKFQRKEEIHE